MKGQSNTKPGDRFDEAINNSPAIKLADIRSESFRRSFHSGGGHDMDETGFTEGAEFVPSKGLTSEEVEKLRKIHGDNELIEKSKTKLEIFIEQFTAPMPIMIWIAITIEAVLNNWPDMWILCGLQAINGGVGYYEMTKAGDAVAALKKSLKPKATAFRDGQWQVINGVTLVPGDLVSLNAGAAVPADCMINHGTIDVDQAALTGESLPVTMIKGDSPKMGSTVARGETEATVIATGMNTFFGKTANMIQSVDELGHLQKNLADYHGISDCFVFHTVRNNAMVSFGSRAKFPGSYFFCGCFTSCFYSCCY